MSAEPHNEEEVIIGSDEISRSNIRKLVDTDLSLFSIDSLLHNMRSSKTDRFLVDAIKSMNHCIHNIEKSGAIVGKGFGVTVCDAPFWVDML